MRSGLINRLVASGFIAAAVATVLCSPISPEHPMPAGSVLARATVYLGIVFCTAALATYLTSLVEGKKPTFGGKEIALRIATTALWLPPMLMFYRQDSWFVLVLFVAFLVEVSRLIVFLREMLREPGLVPAEEQLEVDPFSVLKQEFPCGVSMLAAFMMQGAILGAVAGHAVLAGAFYLVGTAALAFRTFQMFRDFGETGNRNPARRTWTALISATLLIFFAWLPYIALSNPGHSGGSAAGSGGPYLEARESGTGIRNEQHRAHPAASVSDWLQSLLQAERPESRGDSFAVAKRLLESSFPESREGTSTRPNTGNNTNIRITGTVTGPIFPAVKLYPDTQHPTKLVAPPPVASRGGWSTTHSDPFNIPFDGVYWFWRGPSDQPPLNSVVVHGSPAARFFRSTDGDLISMEARQNLGFAVDPRRYAAIEIEIENADPFPNSVSIVLKIRNTAIAGKPSQNLGLERVPAPASSTASGASHETLRFHIPSRLAMGTFDELAVSYFLKSGRSDRSARIAIERFRFIPRLGW